MAETKALPDPGPPVAAEGFQRREPRRRVARAASIVVADRPSGVPCVVLDLTPLGARIHVHRDQEIPDRFSLTIEADDLHVECVIVWRRQNLIGVQFLDKAE